MATHKVSRPAGKPVGLCATRFCRNKRSVRSPYCDKCQMRRWRAKYPFKYAYQNVKRSADMRGISFELTLQEFTSFCIEHGYLEKKGTFAGCMTIDRKDHIKGYTLDNIRPMEHVENCVKGNWEKKNKIKHSELPF